MIEHRERLLIYGASGHGRVLLDAAIASGIEVLGFADDDEKKRETFVSGVKVVAIGFEECADYCAGVGARVIVGIGENSSRKRVFQKLVERHVPISTVIHPRAVVASSAEILEGTVVFAGVVINCDATIGKNSIINTGATIDHDCSIGDHAHISPGVHIGGTVSVGCGTHVGIGTSIKNNTNIGEWSVLGAGSVVVKDIPDRVTAYGVPAVIRKSFSMEI